MEERDIFGDLILEDCYNAYDVKICPDNMKHYFKEQLNNAEPHDILADLIDIFSNEDFKYNYELDQVLKHARKAITDEISTEDEIADFLQLTYERVDSL